MSSPDAVATKGTFNPGRPFSYVRDGSARATFSLILMMADIAALAVTIANLHDVARFVLGLALSGVIPGWSVVGLLRLRNFALELALTVAVSFASLMTFAQILMTVHAWHPEALEIIVSAVCLPLLYWQSRERRETASALK
jgi:uncharacterized membrane protein